MNKLKPLDNPMVVQDDMSTPVLAAPNSDYWQYSQFQARANSKKQRKRSPKKRMAATGYGPATAVPEIGTGSGG